MCNVQDSINSCYPFLELEPEFGIKFLLNYVSYTKHFSIVNCINCSSKALETAEVYVEQTLSLVCHYLDLLSWLVLNLLNN